MARKFFGVFLFCLILSGAFGCSGEKPTFRIAYMICNSNSETMERFDALTAYLSEATGANFVPVYLDTVDFEDAYAKGDIDFTHTNSLLYVALKEHFKVNLVASEKRGTYGPLTRGTIIVRADSPIKTLEDLKGKRLIFGPQWAPYGFLAQYAQLLTSGVDPEQALGPYSFTPGSWKHEKIIYSVLYGAYDAGAAPLIDLEEMTAEGKVAREDFRVIATTPLGPYCTVAVSPKVDQKWGDKVRDALLALTQESTAKAGGETIKVLKHAEVDGYEVLPDSTYDIIRGWAKAAKMPPYDGY